MKWFALIFFFTNRLHILGNSSVSVIGAAFANAWIFETKID